MRHRVFVAVNLPGDIKKEIAELRMQWPELPARWTGKDNLHITLAFLGYISDEELLKTCETAKRVALKHASLTVNLNKILYGPPRKIPPRMVWVEGEKSPELSVLKEDLERSLSGEVHFSSENRSFSPHITLARIKTWEWRRLEPEERPEVNMDINLSFDVSSIEVMESRLKRGGPEYAILESIYLIFSPFY